ncbi:flagellar biosynthetic protein FliO [Chitinivorax sp. PXF-14]|uniref:flagellar biosynthetic protein FliO n=1 Tax=Chitinivorax sp. PXF-14 TaxID=3230488 RepID=UPI003464F7F6
MRGLVLFAAALPAAAFAASPPPVASPSTSIFQVFLGLLLVLALIAACAWLLKRMTPGGLSGAAGMRVVGGLMVGPKERIVVVELDSNWLVLGVTAAQVSLLHSMPKPEGAGDADQPGAVATFPKWLQAALQKRKADGPLSSQSSGQHE